MDSAWEKIDNSYKRRLVSLYFEKRLRLLLKQPLFAVAVTIVMATLFQISIGILESELLSRVIVRYPEIPTVFYLSSIALILGYNIVTYHKMRAGRLEKDFCLHYMRSYYNNYHSPVLEEEEFDLLVFQKYIDGEYCTRFEMYKNALKRINERRI